MVQALAQRPTLTSCCLAPIRFVSEKMRAIAATVRGLAEKVFGHLVRIVTFQLGVRENTPGADAIMSCYKRLSSDPRDEKPLDMKRLKASKELLKKFGGKEEIVHPADNKKLDIHCMTFNAEECKAALVAQGALIQDIEIEIDNEVYLRKALINPPEWLKKLFPATDVKMKDGTTKKGLLLPDAPDFHGASPPVVVHFHSPGRSMCMDRLFVAKHILAGYNVVISDPRGTIESTGTPSEAGYYHDAQAVLDHVFKLGYPINRIYVSGFCMGAGPATYLKQKYHAQGIHLIASNPYTAMEDVLKRYGFFGRLAARYGLSALKDPNSSIPQDGFNNVNKLKKLPHSEGKTILIHTKGDPVVPPESVLKMRLAIERDKAGDVNEILSLHPKPHTNVHMQPPYERDDVWTSYVNAVC